MNRRTSPYTLQVAATPGADLPDALEALVAVLPDGLLYSDKHYATEEGEPYVSVTFRSSDDEAARKISEQTLPRGTEARLTTGLGAHRRLVATWGQEEEHSLLEQLAMDEEQLADAEEASSPRTFSISSSDVGRCPERRLDPAHYREDGTCRHRSSHATDEFNLVWQNDQAVYHAVVGLTREWLQRVPGMTDQTLGRNVKDRVFSWAYGGGWGWASGWGGAVSSLRDEDRYPDWKEGGPPPGYRSGPFSYFLDRDLYGSVSEEEVGEAAREALDLEDGEEEQ